MLNKSTPPIIVLRRVTESLSSNERALFRQALIQQLPEFLERIRDQVKQDAQKEKRRYEHGKP